MTNAHFDRVITHVSYARVSAIITHFVDLDEISLLLERLMQSSFVRQRSGPVKSGFFYFQFLQKSTFTLENTHPLLSDLKTFYLNLTAQTKFVTIKLTLHVICYCFQSLISRCQLSNFCISQIGNIFDFKPIIIGKHTAVKAIGTQQ